MGVGGGARVSLFSRETRRGLVGGGERDAASFPGWEAIEQGGADDEGGFDTVPASDLADTFFEAITEADGGAVAHRTRRANLFGGRAFHCI